MSSSFRGRAAECLDSTPSQASARASRHRSNLSVTSIPKTATSVDLTSANDLDLNNTDKCSGEQNHTNTKQNSSSMSADISHNNNKNIKDNGVVEVERDLENQSHFLKGLSPTIQEDHPMSPEQNSLDHTQHKPQLKVNKASRSSEMPDLSEQSSTFTRSAASTATLMTEAAKERTSPTHNASLKIDEQVGKMMPLKQRMTLSEDASLGDKVKQLQIFFSFLLTIRFCSKIHYVMTIPNYF